LFHYKTNATNVTYQIRCRTSEKLRRPLTGDAAWSGACEMPAVAPAACHCMRPMQGWGELWRTCCTWLRLATRAEAASTCDRYTPQIRTLFRTKTHKYFTVQTLG